MSVDLAVDALAASRLTRLITTDDFPPVKALREWALNRVDPYKVRKVKGAEPPALAELIECNWCAGMWVSGGVVALRRLVPGLWDPLARILATSMVVGLVAGVSEREGDLRDLGKTLDGVGLFVGSSIRAVGAMVADAVRDVRPVPVELSAVLDSEDVADHEHVKVIQPPNGPARDVLSGRVLRESPRTVEQFKMDNQGKQE